MTAELKVVSEVITKNLYGLHANRGEWVLLTSIVFDSMDNFKVLVDEIYNEIAQGGRHVSFWTLIFKPEDFSAFKVE
jgi:hypothetical protein